MKRKLYYFLFSLFGVMLGFLAHAIIELNYIKLLMRNFDMYSFGLSWDDWEKIHSAGVFILVIAGAWLGYRVGRRCWQILYVEQRYSKVLKKKLKQDF